MSDYNAKTNWLPDDPITEQDYNRIEQGIKDSHDNLNQFKNQRNNPHQVTKNQVGLSNVDNVKQAPKSDFDNHANNIDNPHNVTKNQVGLSNVPNNAVASQAEAKSGSSNSRFMTPLRVAEAIQSLATSEKLNVLPRGHFDGNEPANSYPTGVSVMYSGDALESVGFPDAWCVITTYKSTSSSAQLAMPVTNTRNQGHLHVRTQTSSGVWTAWTQTETEAGAQEKVNVHANLTNNPHNVTKAQVGLGSVPNHGLASQAQAEEGTVNTALMTPLRTSQAITSKATTANINRLPNFSKNANDAPASYPVGISAVFVQASDGWFSFGTIITTRTYVNDGSVFQQYIPYNASYGGSKVKFRMGLFASGGSPNAGGWTSWKDMLDSDDFANQPEASAGSNNSKVMTPLRVAQAIISQAQKHKVTNDNGVGLSLSNGHDLNIVYDTGFYRVQAPLNLPSDLLSTSWVYMMVIKQGLTECMQMLIPFNSTDVYTRSSSSNGLWRPWKRLLSMNDLDSMMLSSSPAINTSTVKLLNTQNLIGEGNTSIIVIVCRADAYSRTVGAITGVRSSSSNNTVGQYFVTGGRGTSDNDNIGLSVITQEMQRGGTSLVKITYNGNPYLGFLIERGEFSGYDYMYFRGESIHPEDLKAVRGNDPKVTSVTPYSGGNAVDIGILGAGLNVDGRNAVTESRTIATGNGLTGGGSLASNRTLNVDFASISEVVNGASNNKSITPMNLREAFSPKIEWTSTRMPESYPTGMTVERAERERPSNGWAGSVITVKNIESNTAAHQMFYPTGSSWSALMVRYASGTTDGWGEWNRLINEGDTSITRPSLSNGWTGDLEISKDPVGNVSIIGRISGGGNNTIAFTLPSAFRPYSMSGVAVNRGFLVNMDDGIGTLTISNTGSCRIIRRTGSGHPGDTNFMIQFKAQVLY
ncbi:pyocin knob domain-containing protein [Alkalihalobacillus trypoxylicola]|uniref:Tail fiber protein n=1 Tax=Alkalihalobacillus trypoxylicola TaxID=519424 RepID=A0A162EW95_9BACI|nr:pyocin knob domain-containing protein [Alkalihalobacillus trypoxylicola]KYG33885.1 hypothetical protein AZF04_15335 [Alkalihalobacillus trypoxylicola]